MARGDTEERVKRGVGRVLRVALLLILVIGGVGVWVGLTSFYTLQPGEAAVVLRLGRYYDTVVKEGINFHLPVPIDNHEKVEIGTISTQEFGSVDDASLRAETAMQTRDNNIVYLEFVVRYRIGKAFESRYRIADLEGSLRDAAQAAMREVVGRHTIDGVLSDDRGEIEADSAESLQAILDRYEAGLYIQGVELQEVQPPDAVRDAFDDVIAAAQDRDRKVNEAEGYANEVLPGARAEATELIEAAVGYRDAKIAEASGEAERFLAITAEYQKAPEITRKRMYLETMEAVLPDVEKVLIEPGTASVLPYLPLGRAAPRGGP